MFNDCSYLQKLPFWVFKNRLLDRENYTKTINFLQRYDTPQQLKKVEAARFYNIQEQIKQKNPQYHFKYFSSVDALQFALLPDDPLIQSGQNKYENDQESCIAVVICEDISLAKQFEDSLMENLKINRTQFSQIHILALNLPYKRNPKQSKKSLIHNQRRIKGKIAEQPYDEIISIRNIKIFRKKINFNCQGSIEKASQVFLNEILNYLNILAWQNGGEKEELDLRVKNNKECHSQVLIPMQAENIAAIRTQIVHLYFIQKIYDQCPVDQRNQAIRESKQDIKSLMGENDQSHPSLYLSKKEIYVVNKVLNHYSLQILPYVRHLIWKSNQISNNNSINNDHCSFMKKIKISQEQLKELKIGQFMYLSQVLITKPHGPHESIQDGQCLLIFTCDIFDEKNNFLFQIKSERYHYFLPGTIFVIDKIQNKQIKYKLVNNGKFPEQLSFISTLKANLSNTQLNSQGQVYAFLKCFEQQEEYYLSFFKLFKTHQQECSFQFQNELVPFQKKKEQCNFYMRLPEGNRSFVLYLLWRLCITNCQLNKFDAALYYCDLFSNLSKLKKEIFTQLKRGINLTDQQILKQKIRIALGNNNSSECFRLVRGYGQKLRKKEMIKNLWQKYIQNLRYDQNWLSDMSESLEGSGMYQKLINLIRIMQCLVIQADIHIEQMRKNENKAAKIATDVILNIVYKYASQMKLNHERICSLFTSQQKTQKYCQKLTNLLTNVVQKIVDRLQFGGELLKSLQWINVLENLLNKENKGQIVNILQKKYNLLIKLQQYEEAIIVIKECREFSIWQKDPLAFKMECSWEAANLYIKVEKYQIAEEMLQNIADQMDEKACQCLNFYDFQAQIRRNIVFSKTAHSLAQIALIFNEYENVLLYYQNAFDISLAYADLCEEANKIHREIGAEMKSLKKKNIEDLRIYIPCVIDYQHFY